MLLAAERSQDRSESAHKAAIDEHFGDTETLCWLYVHVSVPDASVIMASSTACSPTKLVNSHFHLRETLLNIHTNVFF